MIRSMTAFARRDSTTQSGVLSWEVRSVNHRYLEVSLRLPEEFRAMDVAVRKLVGTYLARGKVECNLKFQPAVSGAQLSINTELAQQVVTAARQIDHLLYNPAAVNSIDILRWPGVLNPAEVDWEQLRGAALAALEETLQALREARLREGEDLKRHVLQRVDAMAGLVEDVRARMPELVVRQRDKLRARVAELAEQVDAERMEHEVAVLAQKMDVDEEMDRMATHLQEVRRTLDQEEPIGRRLDFLMQELNREANTLGSKSVDVESTRASVELKVLIEQMREQVQNIE